VGSIYSANQKDRILSRYPPFPLIFTTNINGQNRNLIGVMRESNEVSNELRETISTLAVLQSVATNTGHLLELTGTLISWIEAALVQIYGYELTDMDPHVREMLYAAPVDEHNPSSLLDKWEMAVDVYSASQQNWGYAVKACREIRTGLISIGIMEDMLDYKVMNHNFMDEMRAMRLEEIEDKKVT